MDKRLILSVLLVMLSWEFMATNAQNTTASSTNATTAAPSGNATTAAPSGNATTAAPSGNATTAAPSSNATTAAPSGNATTAAPSGNATTAAPSGNATTAAAGNIPTLPAGLSRQGCGSSKLCVAEPSECDPTTGDGCSFLSAKQQSGQTYNFELSGQTDGYVAAGLSTSTDVRGSRRAYICANNNGAVRFFTGTVNNLQLNLTTTLDSSNEVGTVGNGRIQCAFRAVLPDTNARAAGFSLSVSTGDFNSTSGEFGTPSFKIITPVVNLTDPTANITNLLNGTNGTSSAYPVMHTQSFLPVLLVTVCMVAFTTV